MIICFLLNYNPGLTVIIAQSNPSEDLLLNTTISIIFSHTSTAAPCHFINLFSNKYFRNGFSVLSIITDTSFLIDILRCVSSETMGTDERKRTASYSILKDNLMVTTRNCCFTQHLCSTAISYLQSKLTGQPCWNRQAGVLHHRTTER